MPRIRIFGVLLDPTSLWRIYLEDIGSSWFIPTLIVHDFHMEEYVEYQEEQAFHCLNTTADIPSGVQKYPKTTK